MFSLKKGRGKRRGAFSRQKEREHKRGTLSARAGRGSPSLLLQGRGKGKKNAKSVLEIYADTAERKKRKIDELYFKCAMMRREKEKTGEGQHALSTVGPTEGGEGDDILYIST